MGAAQLRAGAVTGQKVKDRSLTGRDINLNRLGTVPAAAHAAPSGEAGGALSGRYPDPAIAANAITSNSLAKGAVTGEKLGAGIPHEIETVVAGEASDSTLNERTTDVSCPPGKLPIGGGANPTFGEEGKLVLTRSHPVTRGKGGAFDGWTAKAIRIVQEPQLQAWGVQVFVICARF